MSWPLKQVLLVCAVLFSLTGRSMADQLSDAKHAYDTGDYAKTLKLLKPLAKQGNALAEFNIGFMYAQGQGVPQDYVWAYMWANTAAANATDSEYQKQYAGLRDSVAKKMTASQITEARELARKCTAKKFKGC